MLFFQIQEDAILDVNFATISWLLRTLLYYREPQDTNLSRDQLLDCKEGISSLPILDVILIHKKSLTTSGPVFMLTRLLLLRKITKTGRLICTFTFTSQRSSQAVSQIALMLECSTETTKPHGAQKLLLTTSKNMGTIWNGSAQVSNLLMAFIRKRHGSKLVKRFFNKEGQFKKLHQRIPSYYLVTNA